MIPSIKYPSAFLPFLISAAALALILGYVAIFGIVSGPETHDERAPARIFQLLMLTESVLVVFFAIKWLPQAPPQTLQILALQVAAALVPIVVIIVLERR